MNYDPEFNKELLHSAILEVYQLESMNLVFSGRWREREGNFRNEEVQDHFYSELIGQNRRKIEGIISDIDQLLESYPSFVVLPLIRSMGSLTVRVVKGARVLEGSMFAVWQVLKRIESHSVTDKQVFDGWAVIRSVWTIMLDMQMDSTKKMK